MKKLTVIGRKFSGSLMDRFIKLAFDKFPSSFSGRHITIFYVHFFNSFLGRNISIFFNIIVDKIIKTIIFTNVFQNRILTNYLSFVHRTIIFRFLYFKFEKELIVHLNRVQVLFTISNLMHRCAHKLITDLAQRGYVLETPFAEICSFELFSVN